MKEVNKVAKFKVRHETLEPLKHSQDGEEEVDKGGGGAGKVPSLTCKYDKQQTGNDATSTSYSLRDDERETGRGAGRLQAAARVTRTRPSRQR